VKSILAEVIDEHVINLSFIVHFASLNLIQMLMMLCEILISKWLCFDLASCISYQLKNHENIIVEELYLEYFLKLSVSACVRTRNSLFWNLNQPIQMKIWLLLHTSCNLFVLEVDTFM